LPLVLVPLCGWSCRGFSPVGPDEGLVDGQVQPGDGPTPTSDIVGPRDGPVASDLALALDYESGGQGPGPLGALPTGYCCASDDDCRNRNCIQLKGASFCADSCQASVACASTIGTFVCVGATGLDVGQCEPAADPFTCVAASSFRYGKKASGACCTPLYSGLNGLECMGGQCSSFGSTTNPWVCTNACSTSANCPGGYFCAPVDKAGVCFPSSDPYSCSK
jgi:hypothetical protein